MKTNIVAYILANESMTAFYPEVDCMFKLTADPLKACRFDSSTLAERALNHLAHRELSGFSVKTITIILEIH